MDLPAWRDLSLILLAIESILLGVPLAVAGYYVVRYLRVFRRWLAANFPVWQAELIRGRDMVEKYSRYVATPVISLGAFASWVRTIGSLRQSSLGTGRSSYL